MSGITSATVPVDWQTHDTYHVVSAHRGEPFDPVQLRIENPIDLFNVPEGSERSDAGEVPTAQSLTELV